MTWTQHGHHIPTSPTDDEQGKRPPVARCGGTHLCKKCKADFAAYLAGKKNMRSEESNTPDPYETRTPVSFNTKPGAITAIKLSGRNADEVARWTGGEIRYQESEEQRGVAGVIIPTLVAPEFVELGRYVLRSERGQFTSVSAQEFERTYRPPIRYEGDSVTATTQDTEKVIKGSYDDIADHIRRAGTSGNYERSADTGPNGSWPPSYVPNKPKLGE